MAYLDSSKSAYRLYANFIIQYRPLCFKIKIAILPKKFTKQKQGINQADKKNKNGRSSDRF